MTRVDLSLPLIVALLLAAGLVTLSTAAPGDEFTRQLVFLGPAAVAVAAVLWAGRKRIVRFAPQIYVTSLVLLLAVRVFGTTVNGARSWLYLGPLPGFQPSEFAKLALVLALAAALHDRPIRRWLDYLRPAVLIALPTALVLAEPDLGGALVLVAIGGGMVLVRGVPLRHVVLVALLAAVAIPTLVVPNLREHQTARIVAFLNPGADPQGAGYQVIQSTIAVGSGGLLGKGYGQGTQSQLGFIPFRQTDFIFPVLAEEGGFVAAVALLLLYGLLFWRLVAMASECAAARDQLVIVGVLVFVGFQVVVNVGVTLGLAPVTGITLPLVSYGGTSLLSTLVALALAFTINRDRFADW
ncbi:MAG: rod shape-determining protein RodA [Trueperaceae bacterium]|nr:rod shape-determining protein RodA [Trueperaceae bacterium]